MPSFDPKTEKLVGSLPELLAEVVSLRVDATLCDPRLIITPPPAPEFSLKEVLVELSKALSTSCPAGLVPVVPLFVTDVKALLVRLSV